MRPGDLTSVLAFVTATFCCWSTGKQSAVCTDRRFPPRRIAIFAAGSVTHVPVSLEAPALTLVPAAECANLTEEA